MNHLQNLGNRISIPIRAGDDGYVGRECAVKECLGYFKVTPGTGVKGRGTLHLSLLWTKRSK